MKMFAAFACVVAVLAVSTYAGSVPVPSEASSSAASPCQSVVLRLQASASAGMGAQDWRLFCSEATVGTCALNCRMPRGGVIILR